MSDNTEYNAAKGFRITEEGNAKNIAEARLENTSKFILYTVSEDEKEGGVIVVGFTPMDMFDVASKLNSTAQRLLFESVAEILNQQKEGENNADIK